jgi:hypothetical protein
MKKPTKILHRFKVSDIATVIADYFEQIQSPDGHLFKASHIVDDVLVIKINNQSFIINISEKSKLS